MNQLADALEKRMTKKMTKAVVNNINAMEADVTEAGSGNGQGAAVRRDATPLTTVASSSGTRVRFRLPTEA